MTNIIKTDKFTPGIREGINLSMFTLEERRIITYLTKFDWYLTRCQLLKISKSEYKVVLMKPSEKIKSAFNLSREVIFSFSPYKEFEPRSIDSIDSMDIQELRIEEICSVIISNDDNVQNKISAILKTNQEARVIIPFSYKELLDNTNDYQYLFNKFRKNFYTRDLFGIQDPLKKDVYFFGRRELIHELVNKHLQAENSGIFGLRKTGKTSILYGIERALDRKKSTSVFIDCQTLHLKSWNTALLQIIQELQKKHSIRNKDLKLLDNYQNFNFVSDSFQDDLLTIYHKSSKKSILLIFDEIEHITFDTSVSEGWKSGQDYLRFFQIIRSTYQKFKDDNVLTYLITGTNPKCLEAPSINGVDNPIFSQFHSTYIPPFDFKQTKEMVDKLGGYMGLSFDEHTCSQLVEDFGGHPLLMRQMCSFIHKKIGDRPFNVKKDIYNASKAEFYQNESGFVNYAKMVLEVLDNWYPDESQMLIWLSNNDLETFNGLAEKSPEYISHLLNYGIISKNRINGYDFTIESLKEYLSNKNKYYKLNMSNEEKQSEISQRRNKIEPSLRKLVKNNLKINLGETEAKRLVIKTLYGAKEYNKHCDKDYGDFFDSNKSNIYLSNLFEIIRLHWENGFKNIFEGTVDVFIAKTTIINHLRKIDAHASTISDSDFQTFRGSMEWLEKKVNDFI